MVDATVALQQYMKDNNIYDLYRFKETRNFGWKIHSYLYSFGLTAKWAPGNSRKGCVNATATTKSTKGLDTNVTDRSNSTSPATTPVTRSRSKQHLKDQ